MNFFDKINLLVKLGWRNILRQKRRSYLVISSAMVGVSGVYFTMALFNGFIDAMITNGIQSGLGHVQIRPEGYLDTRKMGLFFDESEKLNKAVSSLKLKNAFYSRRLEKEGLLRLGSFTQGVMMIGVDPETEQNVSLFSSWVNAGDFFKTVDGNDELIGIIPCLIGGINAKKMDALVGDWAVLSVAGTEGAYRSVRCRIQGLINSGIEPFDKYTVIVRRADLSRLISGNDSLISYFVFLTDSIDDAAALKSSLQKPLSGIRHIEILTFSEIEKILLQMLQTSEQFMWIAYLIMLIGVALILFDSVTMSVFEMMHEIGIIRAIGSGPAILFWMILFESFLLALVGAILATLFSEAIILYFQYNGLSFAAFAEGMEAFAKMGTTIYPSLTLKNIFDGFVFSLLISFLSGLYPAWKAVNILPVKAIYNR